MRFIKTASTLLLVVCALAAALPACAEVAVVRVAEVIDSSAPGRAAQKYIDNLRAALDDEFTRYAKRATGEKNAPELIAQKEAEVDAELQREFDRVTALVVAELRKVIDQWLKADKKGVTVVLPAHETLGYAKAADISGEILRRLNAVTIDFTVKK